MNGPVSNQRWIVAPRPVSGARLKLICFPHAGAGAASYIAWAERLRASHIEPVAIQYPGRENRISEPAIVNVDQMIHALAQQWESLTDYRPYALFGHSMGALLCYELARELERRQVPNRPRRLFLSGRNPPHIPPTPLVIQHLPDREFLQAIGELYGNFPEEVLANAELAALVAMTLRADFTLLSRYSWRASGPLDSSFTILGGADDPWTSETQLSQWQQHTRFPTRVHLLPGGHFFHQKSPHEALRLIARECEELMEGGARGLGN